MLVLAGSLRNKAAPAPFGPDEPLFPKHPHRSAGSLPSHPEPLAKLSIGRDALAWTDLPRSDSGGKRVQYPHIRSVRRVRVGRVLRHAEFLAALPEPAAEPVNPWSRPWTGPAKEEAQALFRHQTETTMELGIIRERRRAAALATLGVDYPYTYEGAPFPESAFAAAGVSA